MKPLSKQPTAPVEPTKLARRENPDTSHAAASLVGSFAHAHHTAIVNALLASDNSLNVYDIGKRCGLEPHAIGKRMKELQTAGIVEVDTDLLGNELTSPTPSGRLARRWMLTACYRKVE